PAFAAIRRAVTFAESSVPPTHPLRIATVVNAGNVFLQAHRWSEAGDLFERALEAAREAFGEEHALTVSAMSGYASVLRERRQKQEAAVLESRAREIRGRLIRAAAPQTVDVRDFGK